VNPPLAAHATCCDGAGLPVDRGGGGGGEIEKGGGGGCCCGGGNSATYLTADQ